MSRWFRVYDDMVDDPKVQRLPDASFKALVNLWCLASQNDGELPPNEDIAFKLRMKLDKVEVLIAALAGCGLLDCDATSARPHNWNARQFKSDVSNERVKRHRERKCNVTDTVTDTVTVTPPDTESESETEQTKQATRASALVSDDDWPKNYREVFWEMYPSKIGKPLALGKLDRVRKSGKVTFLVLMEGLRAYAHKADDRKWCNPATWLNQERWGDQPALDPQSPRDAQQQRSDDAYEQLRAFNRSRATDDRAGDRFLLENSGEGAADFHDGDDRADGNLPDVGRRTASERH